MNERALVIGGAGAAGNAWAIGVVAGLFEGGLDVTDADVIIGTSSGSTTAAQVAGTIPPLDLYAATVAGPPQRPGPGGPHSRDGAPGRGGDQAGPHLRGGAAGGGPGRAAANRPSGRPDAAGANSQGAQSDRRGPGGAGPAHASVASLLERTSAIIAAASDPADMRRKLGTAALELDAVADPGAGAQRRALVASRLPGQDWPDTPIRIVAVDAHTGEPVVFDRDSGVALADAITASTSGPGAPPHTIGDHRYIDGGYRAGENADLATGFARVLVLSPFGGRSRTPAEWGIHLADQVDELRAQGSAVETVFPDGDAVAIFAYGANQMDPANRPPAARAGFEQGRALAGRLAEFWR